MSEFKIANKGTIIRLRDGANIPPDPANRDYSAYLAWVEAGGVPLPADPEPDTTAESIRAQMRALENRQARAVRECLLAMAQQGVHLPADAASRLASIEADISALRQQLAGGGNA